MQKKFEITHPEQVIDYLGMMGDAVDNIPGLPCLYMHFTMEHNHGHHKYVATEDVPFDVVSNPGII